MPQKKVSPDTSFPSYSPTQHIGHVFTNPSLDLLPDAPITRHSATSPLSSEQTLAAASHIPLREPGVGVKFISVSHQHILLLTYSGEVYGWGRNFYGQVFHNGPCRIKSPIKLSLTGIISISAGITHSLALSSEGKLYGWGECYDSQICLSYSRSLPITQIEIPFNPREVYGGGCCSFAVSKEGQVIKWGDGKPFELIEELNGIASISVFGDSFVAIDGNGDFFCFNLQREEDSSDHADSSSDDYYSFDDSIEIAPITEIPITNHSSLKRPFQSSFLFDSNCLFVIDFDGNVWKFIKNSDNFCFNEKPTQIGGLTNIVSISGCEGIYSAVDINGKGFVWGKLSRLSDFYEDSEEPQCIKTFTNIEGISLGYNFLFAYNKNTVWAWGRNNVGQLGTGDLLDRPQPVQLFLSEILGRFRYPKQPLDRMFSGLIKLVYWEYLNFLDELFGNHPYVKARFHTKCGISRRAVQFAQEVFNVHSIQNKMCMQDPQNLELDENICELQLRLSITYNGPNVINRKIKKLDVYYNGFNGDSELFQFFPNVENVRFGGRSILGRKSSINLEHLSKLQCLELDCTVTIQKLPTSLAKLVLKHQRIVVTDLSYLTSLKELLVLSRRLSKNVLKGEVALSNSIVTLEVCFHVHVNIQMQLTRVKELVIDLVPTNITGQNFPSLQFIQLRGFDKDSLSNSPLSPLKFKIQGLIKSVKLIKNEFLVELSCFPWWIQYSANGWLIDVFGDYVDVNKI
ncbi:hypothetical protein P9112_010572 [Eukaryota sp. TZLM1-RC]